MTVSDEALPKVDPLNQALSHYEKSKVSFDDLLCFLSLIFTELSN